MWNWFSTSHYPMSFLHFEVTRLARLPFSFAHSLFSWLPKNSPSSLSRTMGKIPSSSSKHILSFLNNPTLPYNIFIVLQWDCLQHVRQWTLLIYCAYSQILLSQSPCHLAEEAVPCAALPTPAQPSPVHPSPTQLSPAQSNSAQPSPAQLSSALSSPAQPSRISCFSMHLSPLYHLLDGTVLLSTYTVIYVLSYTHVYHGICSFPRVIWQKSFPCHLTPQETESSQGPLITQL